jgi:hypothetical protein
MVQAIHAGIEAGSHFVPPGMQPPALAVLAVADEAELLVWHDAAQAVSIRCRVFFEPDYSPMGSTRPGHHSAFATEPIGAELRSVFAALRPVRFRKGVAR